MGEWIVDIISFQKIFGLCGLKCHIVEIWRDVTLVDRRWTECEDGARILETEFAIPFLLYKGFPAPELKVDWMGWMGMGMEISVWGDFMSTALQCNVIEKM